MNVTLKQGFGYYDCTVYPIGGDFHRAVKPLSVKLTGPIGDYGHGCNAKGETETGRVICFNIAHATEARTLSDGTLMNAESQIAQDDNWANSHQGRMIAKRRNRK